MKAFSRITLVAAAVLSTTAYPAPTIAATGNSLYEWCTKSATIGKALCASYITGVRDGIVADNIIGKRPIPFCIRDGVTIEQLVAVTKKFMDDNPSIRDQNAAAIVEFAFVGAFPCAR